MAPLRLEVLWAHSAPVTGSERKMLTLVTMCVYHNCSVQADTLPGSAVSASLKAVHPKHYQTQGVLSLSGTDASMSPILGKQSQSDGKAFNLAVLLT